MPSILYINAELRILRRIPFSIAQLIYLNIVFSIHMRYVCLRVCAFEMFALAIRLEKIKQHSRSVPMAVAATAAAATAAAATTATALVAEDHTHEFRFTNERRGAHIL